MFTNNCPLPNEKKCTYKFFPDLPEPHLEPSNEDDHISSKPDFTDQEYVSEQRIVITFYFC